MNCYVHHEKSAVGLCKSCGRGLCPECVVEVGESLSCSGRCEDKVHTLNMMVEKNAQLVSTSNQALRSAARFSMIMGGALLAFGIWQYSKGLGFLPYFLMVLGLIFLANGVLRSRRSAQYPIISPIKTERES